MKAVSAHFVFSPDYDVTCGLLNGRIKRHNYGPYDSSTKPSPCFTPESLRNVETEKRLHERAAQTRCLLRVFPFLVADKVSSNDPYLQLIIKINQITEMIFAPAIRKSNLTYL